MWVPASATEIEAAARAGELIETSSFDVKAALPARGRNSDLATDVAAMSTDGGVLLYGVAEDQHRQPTVPAPITLAGLPERVDQIVQTSVMEAPYIDVRTYPSEQDAGVGYLLVIVPQSARAPHQVTVGGDLRFYGRGATGNRLLTEGEIARLYRRREEWEQDREALLAQAIAAAPFEPQPDLAFMHGFARPVAPDQAIWDRAVERSGGRDALHRALANAAAERRTTQDYAPGLHGGPRWHRVGADAWRLSTQVEREPGPRAARYVVSVEANIDGRGHLFCGRAAERRSARAEASKDEAPLVIYESIIAGNLGGFLALMGALYAAGGYHGHVDIGGAVAGLQGGYSSTIPQHGFYTNPYNAETYPRTERVAAAALAEPAVIVRRMLRHLFEATIGRGDFDALV